MEALVRVTRGIWRPESQVADLAGRAAAVLAAFGDDCVLAGITAARLRNLWLPPWALDDTLPIEVIVRRDIAVPARRSGSRRGEVHARRQRLAADDVTSLAGLPIVSEAKCWVDLAARLAEPDLVALGDVTLRGATSVPDLIAAIERARHCRGVVRARAVLAHLNAASRSRPESHLRYALVSRGLPEPQVNQPIFDALGEWLAEPDLSYKKERLAIEYNGSDHAELSRMRRDITRERDMDVRGDWRMLTFGPAQVFGRPDEIASRVRMHLVERSRRRPADPWLAS